MNVQDATDTVSKVMKTIDEKASKVTSKIQELQEFIQDAPQTLAGRSDQFIDEQTKKAQKKIDDLTKNLQEWVDKQKAKAQDWLKGVISDVAKSKAAQALATAKLLSGLK